MSEIEVEPSNTHNASDLPVINEFESEAANTHKWNGLLRHELDRGRTNQHPQVRGHIHSNERRKSEYHFAR
jgi:hypothetical protein